MTGIVLLAVLAALALLSRVRLGVRGAYTPQTAGVWLRSEEHTSELQSPS